MRTLAIALALALAATTAHAVETHTCKLNTVTSGTTVLCDISVLDVELRAQPVRMIGLSRSPDGKPVPYMLEAPVPAYDQSCEHALALAVPEQIERIFRAGEVQATFLGPSVRDSSGAYLARLTVGRQAVDELLVREGYLRPAEHPALVGPPKPWCRDWRAPEDDAPWCGT